MINQDQNGITGFLFKQLLKMKRKQMKPASRKRSQGIKGSVWLYPWSQEREYKKYLFNLMNVYSNLTISEMRQNLPRWVNEQRSDSIRADQFEPEFNAFIDQLEQTQFNMFDEKGTGASDEKGNLYSSTVINAALVTLAYKISNVNKKQSNKFITKILGVPFEPAEPWIENTINVWVRENYRLIKSLSDDYIKNLNRIVYDGVLGGKPWDAIMKDIQKMDKDLTRNRTRLLARDQVGKLNGRLTKRRQQEVNVEWYSWLTANDERVRGRPGGKFPNAKPSHWTLNNKVCRWDDESVYADSIEDAREDKWKKRSSIGAYEGIPGIDIQCRCSALPLYVNQIEEVDNELKKENI